MVSTPSSARMGAISATSFMVIPRSMTTPFASRSSGRRFTRNTVAGRIRSRSSCSIALAKAASGSSAADGALAALRFVGCV